MNKYYTLAIMLVSTCASSLAAPNTMSICGNPSYCLYDVPTYGSADAAEQAFYNAVIGAGLPLGQENFSNYTISENVTRAGPITYSGGGAIEILSGANGNNTIPNGSGNYVAESLAIIGSGLTYIGFDYATGDYGCDNGQPHPCFGYVSGPSITYFTNEPLKGFFGIIASSSLGFQGPLGLVAPVNMDLDNVLWAQGPGIGPNNPLFPDQQVSSGGSGGGCGKGKVCWFWYAVLGYYLFFDPPTASSYTYQTVNGSLFTSVSGFPSGFTAPFDVSSGDTDFGLFGPGQTLTFPNGGVSSFTISGITPGVDGTSPTAFPIQLNFSAPLVSFEAIASQFFVPPSEISVTASGLAYSRVSRTFNGSVTITNISSNTISGPFEILFSSLTPGVSLVNATGVDGVPYYINVPTVAELAPGASAIVSVQFSNPSDAAVHFTPVVFAGSAN